MIEQGIAAGLPKQ